MKGDRDFPLPRDLLPDITVPYHDYLAYKDFSSRLLAHTVNAYEHFAYNQLSKVDTKLWKAQSSRDKLALFRERRAGRASESLYECAAASSLATSLTPNVFTSRTILLTGIRCGFVENAINTLVTQSQEELALVIRYLHGASSDCGILHTMEGPTDSDPLHYLGLKYYVSQAVGDPRLCKRRHCVYLEDSGLIRTRTNENLGYHIMHSVQLSQFPDLRTRNSIPAFVSSRFLYRQRQAGRVELFMLANMDVRGLLVKPISLHFAFETAFNMSRLLDCSETKRLTQMAREYLTHKNQERCRANNRANSSHLPSHDPNSCRVCLSNWKDGGVEALHLVDCLTCGRAICSRCRTPKHLFVSSQDGLLGQLIRVPVCTGCILETNTSVLHVLQAQQCGRSQIVHM